jgi:hypothetical protein
MTGAGNAPPLGRTHQAEGGGIGEFVFHDDTSIKIFENWNEWLFE